MNHAKGQAVYAQVRLCDAWRTFLLCDTRLSKTPAFGGLFSKSIGKKSFSAHVRWCEHGAPLGLGGQRTVPSMVVAAG